MKKSILFALLGFAIISTGCQKEATPLSVTPESISLYTEMTKQITATPSEGVSYESSDPFYAKVDESGLVTANKVGKTNITVKSPNGVKSVPVTVIPKYTLYEDLTPYVNASLSTITSKFGSSYTTATNSDGSVTYTYKNPTSYASGFGFIIKNGVCTSVMVAVSTSYASMITDYLIERYYVVGMQNDMFFFLDHDKKVAIAMSVYSYSMISVLYYPYNAS